MVMDDVFCSTGSGFDEPTPPRQPFAPGASWDSYYNENYNNHKEHISSSASEAASRTYFSSTHENSRNFSDRIPRNDSSSRDPNLRNHESALDPVPVTCLVASPVVRSSTRTQERRQHHQAEKNHSPLPAGLAVFDFHFSYSSESESPRHTKRRKNSSPEGKSNAVSEDGNPAEMKAVQQKEESSYTPTSKPPLCRPTPQRPSPGYSPYNPGPYPRGQPAGVYGFGDTPERQYYYSYPTSLGLDYPSYYPVDHYNGAKHEVTGWMDETGDHGGIHQPVQDQSSSHPIPPPTYQSPSMDQPSPEPQVDQAVAIAVTFSPSTNGEKASDKSTENEVYVHGTVPESPLYDKPSKDALKKAGTPRAREAINTWYERLADLYEYKKKYGDCLVPQKYMENPSLGIWVNKQRMEYKLREDGEKSSLTEEKLLALQEIGFVWAKRKGQHSWDVKYNELKMYKQMTGDCLVPTKYTQNPALGRWVSTQRSQYKVKKQGGRKKCKNPLTDEREEKLTKLGFKWSLLPNP